MSRKQRCILCERRQGDKVDRGGDYDGVPLGEVTECSDCGQWSCPDCQHEMDCCRIFIELHANFVPLHQEGA